MSKKDKPVTLAPARRRGLGAEVADMIRSSIFTGAFQPGDALREVDLSKALEVSRGPVRDALQLLEREGIVRSEWHRGATVTVLSDQDVAELDSLRGALEHLAVRRVVEQAGDFDLIPIEIAAKAMQRAEDPYGMVRCDIEFHDAVYLAAKHSRLLEAWYAIRSQVFLFLIMRVNTSTADYLDHVRLEHDMLVAALKARNLEAALEMFAVHRKHAFDLLTSS
ncbi:GntR family transcriptional regulator [Lentzea sp. PSKA42]|jgi:DNA-binding GntR family transcriptional regulator|uniref:GntR family transcriptional regulator n=1 Tax=Lentzea indica TaxID=2604800 RepID=A0ABX1FTG2_9PSEU|nr:GntR family transcriptional regulator [Lentzea indica]NKE62328.1 GntR family transcriptional regulator [Lentzea indica]